MSSKLIILLHRLNGWRIWLIFTVGVLICAELIVAAMDWLLLGEISRDYLITGFVTACIVAPTSLALLTHFLREFSQSEQRTLAALTENSKTQLTQAMNAAQMVFWELDFVTGELRYEDSMQHWLDTDSHGDAHTVAAWLNKVHPDDRPLFMERFQSAVAQDGSEFDAEYRVEKIGGGWTWVQSRGRVVQRSPEGEPLLAAGGSLNIQARKLTELALAETKERLQNIFNDNPDLMLISRLADGLITEVNETFVRVSGYSKEEAIGNTTVGLGLWTHAEDRKTMTEALIRQGYCSNLESEFITKDGSHIIGALEAIITHLGGVPHILATVRDITSRKQVEAQLQKSETLLRSTLESTDEGILMIGQDSRVLSANKRFLELWRIPPSLLAQGDDNQLLSYAIEQLNDPEDFLGLVRKLYTSDEQARDILHFKDGRVFARFTQALKIGEDLGRIWCFKDITEQYHAEAELEAIKERYDFATHVGKVGTWDWNPRTGTLFWSDETFRLMGFEPGSITPTYDLYLELVHPDDREFLNGGVQAALEKKKPYALDCRIVLGNETEIVCHVTGKVEFDENGQPKRMLGTIQDITDRKQVELALAESRNLLKIIIDTSPMRVFWKDRNLRYLGCNPAFAKDAGKTLPEELLGKDDFEMTWSAQAELYQADDKQVMDSGIAKLSYDEPQTTPDGDTIWLRTSKVPLRDGAGKTIGILGIYEDITAQKHAELALKSSEQKLLTILDNVDAFIYLKDMGGRYLFANRRVRELWGAEMEDIIGYGDEKFFDADTTKAIQQNDNQVLNYGEVINIEETNTVPATGKSATYISTKLPLRRDDGSIYALCGISTDITLRIQAEDKLRASEERAQSLFTLLRLVSDNVPDMIWAKDLNKRYLFANKAICEQLLGASDTDEPVGKDDMFFALRERSRHPDNPHWHTFGELCQDSDAITLQNGKPSRFDEFGNVRGKFLFLDVHKAPLINDKGELIGVVGSGRDVTEQKSIEERLRLASLVLENSSEAMLVTDADNRIVDTNPAFTELTGYSREEVLGRDPALLHSGKHSASFYQEMWKQIDATDHWQGEIWNRRKSGELYAEWLTINTIRHEDGAVHRRVALFSDITDKKKTEELIWTHANFDQLTQLPNRRMFQDRLAHELKKAHRTNQQLALMFLDLDRFKEINDTLGHDRGDELLAEAAKRLLSCVRESDTVARLGGDEFTIIVAELDDAGCVERIAEAILHALAEPYTLNNEVAYVSASIGITLYPEDATTMEEMLRNADQAMYVAKNAGRNRFSYFTNAMQEAAQYRLHLLNDLRNAIPEGQLQLHYQPIIELATGRVHKAEALLRWFHPMRGLISPAEFIPLAEESGLIFEIGDWVFAESARQAQIWRMMFGTDFQISVNKSPLQIQSHPELRRWRQHLQAQDLSGKNIVVEITEGLLLDSSPAVIAELIAFRDAGIQVALDDFGTGYSALSYLKKLDIDYIKIDQSFIRNLATDSNDMALVEAIVVMAHKLALKVIAEGVETTEQRKLLTAIRCDYAQGYLYSRPIPAHEFEQFMSNLHKD